jgi:TPR repeat protein
MGSLPTHSKPSKSIPMRKLTATLCLTITVLLGSMGVSASTDFQKGYQAFKNSDYAKALIEFEPLAKEGNALAQVILGLMYLDGHGVPKDNKTAVKWYTLAAEQGDADAQYNLGVMYENGQGVPQDYKTAVKWYRLAAAQGNATTQKNLNTIKPIIAANPLKVAEEKKLQELAEKVVEDKNLQELFKKAVAAKKRQELVEKAAENKKRQELGKNAAENKTRKITFMS